MQKDDGALLALKIFLGLAPITVAIIYGLSEGGTAANVNIENIKSNTPSTFEGYRGLFAESKSNEPYIVGWGMLTDFVIAGSELECYGLDSHDYPDSGSVYELMHDNFYSELNEWAFTNYLVIHRDGSYSVRDWHEKWKQASVGETYCVPRKFKE